MAWNPSPEVAVARDAAARYGKIHNAIVNRVIILYTTADGRIGMASYGQTRELCSEAGKFGDKLYAEMREHYGE